MKTIYIIILLLFLSSCNILRFAKASFSKRENESLKVSNNYLVKRGLDTTFSYKVKPYCIDSLSNENYAINLYKINTGSTASPVQIRMFDNKGEYISGWEQCYGDLKYFDFMDSIPFKAIPSVQRNSKINLYKDLTLIDIHNIEKLLNKINNSDYVITIYWAKWTGYYSKEVLKEVKTYYDRYKNDYKITLIFINTTT